jgi:hypothetical protein
MTEEITEQEDNEATLPGQHEDEELEKEIIENLRKGRRHWSSWRADARKDYDFYAGKQWDEEDVRILSEQNRPAVTFNRTLRILNAFTGIERQNRQETKFSPIGIEDSAYSDAMNNAAKWARESCNAEDEESEAYLDCGICGVGWTETRMDYEIDSEGKIIVDRIDPLEMLVDPDAKKRNFEDARWVAHVKEVSKKELIGLGFNPEDARISSFWKDAEGEPLSDFNEGRYEGDDSDKLSKENHYSLVHYQYWERQTLYKVQDVTGQTIVLPKDKFERLEPFIQSQNLPYARYQERIYKRCFVLGNKTIDHSELGCKHFTFHALTGLRDKNKNHWFALVRVMRDPQMWANKWLSQIQHILNSGAKNGLIAEQGAISNPGKFEAEFAKPGSISIVRDGALSQGKIQPKEAPRFPEGLDRLLQYALQSINDVTGVNLELMGMANRDQPIGLEDIRKQAGMTIIATFLDSLRYYRKSQGHVLAYFIKEYIADGRLIRILGDEGAKYVPLIKDAVAFKYDIFVEDAPTSPNMKERTFLILKEILPLVLQAGLPIPPDILDYSPLPDALIQKWKSMLKPSPEADQIKQIKSLLAQFEVLGKERDIAKTDSEIILNQAKAQQAAAIGQDETAQSMQKMGLMNRDHELKSEAMMQEQRRKDIEMQLNHVRKLLETELNAKIKAQQQPQGF